MYAVRMNINGTFQRGVREAWVDEEGHLWLRMSDGAEIDLGSVKGPKGDDGILTPEQEELLGKAVLTDGSRPMTWDLDMGGCNINHVSYPTENDMAANKLYVDREIDCVKTEKQDKLTQEQLQKIAGAVDEHYVQVQTRGVMNELGLAVAELETQIAGRQAPLTAGKNISITTVGTQTIISATGGGGGGDISLDTTLTKPGFAADAAAVGDALARKQDSLTLAQIAKINSAASESWVNTQISNAIGDIDVALARLAEFAEEVTA